jgi:gliding motility-associated-like protein
MQVKKLLLAIISFIGLGMTSHAQLVCPPNIDFELGDLTGWSYFIGSCCPGGTAVATTPTTPIACRHTLTKVTGSIGCAGGPLDAYGGFPVVAPGGGSYSLKLGNNGTGGQAEKARFYIHIPPGSDNYSLIYRYAVVFQDPGHIPSEQPRFVVNAFDSATLAPVPCAQYTYVSDGSIPGFMTSTVAGTTVRYKDWTTSTIDLSGLAGVTVGIDFTSGDCDLGGHFGYGYIDMSCGLFRISAAMCDTNTPPVLTAPDGFADYYWYDSATFSILYGTGQTITIPFPPAPVTIAVILVPYAGFGCPDTLYTTIRPAALAITPSNDTTICPGRSVVLESNATDIAVPLSYHWAPAAGLSCTTCSTPVATPTVTTAYSLTVTNTNGCTAEHVYNITILPALITNITVDTPSCHGYTDGSATVNVMTGVAPYSYTWSTAPVQTSSIATGLGGDTFSVVVVDFLGCTDTNSVIILDPDPRIIAIDTYYHPTTCLGADGSIVIEGSIQADTAYTVNFLFDGIPSVTIITADGTGRITIGGLGAGTYSNITITGATCDYNIIGPIVLVDPPTPDLSGVTSNSFVCVGDTLKLFATSSTVGVLYSWEGPGGYTSVSPNPIILPAAMTHAGVYSVTVSKASCYNYGSTLVEIRPLPEPMAGSNSPVCSNDTLFLTSYSTTGATSYEWNGPGFYNSYQQNPYIAHVQTVATGAYTVSVTLNGCMVPAEVNVVINQTPDAPVIRDTNYCENDIPVEYYAEGVNLLWYNSATNGAGVPTAPVPSTAKNGIYPYYVSQTSAEGCMSERSMVTARVWTYPELNLAVTDSVSCAGKYVTFTVENVEEGSSGYTWQFEGTDSTKDVNPIYHSFNNAGVYTVATSAYYQYCPTIQLTRVISIYPFPSIDLGPDTTICPGSMSVKLSGKVNTFGYNAAWKWNNGATTPEITIVSPGTYHATLTINGCSSTDSIYVANDCYMTVPNVFTPNGDGINDFFFPRQLLTRGLIDFDMSVFNRWGQVIFEGKALDGRGWDGNFNGVPQPEGVYIYLIDAVFKDGQKETHKGNVTLLR